MAKYSVSTTIKNGTLYSPSASTISVSEGESVLFNFVGNDGTTFNYMTIDGTEVTPSIVEAEEGQDSTTATYTYTTNYSIYSTYALANAFDGDTSTNFWSNGAQTAGKYILITFNKYINLTSFETYSSNSGDYPNTNEVLQVSSDGSTWTTVGTFQASQTSTFSGLSTGNIKYVRIYATSSISNWLYINTITMTYTTPEIPSTVAGYAYTLSNITSGKNVVISFKLPNGVFVNLANLGWQEAEKVYKKTDSGWEEMETDEFYTYIKDKKVKKN